MPQKSSSVFSLLNSLHQYSANNTFYHVYIKFMEKYRFARNLPFKNIRSVSSIKIFYKTSKYFLKKDQAELNSL